MNESRHIEPSAPVLRGDALGVGRAGGRVAAPVRVGGRRRAALATALAAMLLAAAPHRASAAPDPSPGGAGPVSLGPLADRVTLGEGGPWTAQAEDGALVLIDRDAPNAARFYDLPWQGDLTAGRSAGVRVGVTDAAGTSGAGLIFHVVDGDPRWLALVVTGKNTVAFYARRADGLRLIGETALPGASPPGGHLLQIEQKGDDARLIVDGRPFLRVPPGHRPGDSATAPAPVGIVAFGPGRFTFKDFAFAGAVAPGTDRPEAGNPPQPPARSPGPPPVARAPSGPPSLGPLAGAKDGHEGAWTITVNPTRLVLSNETDADGVYSFVAPWKGTAEAGRSVSLRVSQSGATGSNHGPALLVGVDEPNNRYLAFTMTPEGRAALFRIVDGEMTYVTSLEVDGDRSAGDLLEVSQRGQRLAFLADGEIVATLEPGDGRGLDTSGSVGVAGLGKGRFTITGFGFGPGLAGDFADMDQSQTQARLDPLAGDILGATIGILTHELGHFAIGELKIPATGPEEDVADEVATMNFVDNIRVSPAGIAPLALGFAKFWLYSAGDRGDAGQPPWYDEHAPDMARFGRVMCVLYGADPMIFQGVVNAAKIPERTQQRCIQDEPKRHRAWASLLRPHRRRGADPLLSGDLDPATPGHRITVAWSGPKDPALQPFAEQLHASHFFDNFAEGLTKLYVVPRDTRLVFRDCDQVNCFYNPFDGSVTMCWEMIASVIKSYSKHEGTVKDDGRTPGGRTPVRNPT